MTKKLYSLTEEHKAQLTPHNDKWIANNLRTGSYTEEEKLVGIQAIKDLYAAADLAAPEHVIFGTSPLSCALAAGIASAVWALREKKSRIQLSDACCIVIRKLQSKIGVGIFDDVVNMVEQVTGFRIKTSAKKKSPHYDFLKEHVKSAMNMWNSGNMYSGYVSYLSFFKDVVKLDIDYSKYVHYETATKFGPRLMHEKFTIISCLPEQIHMDEQNRPHHPTGPNLSWPDGVKLYYWHGVNVPAEWIESPETVDASLALTWENIEQRRCLAEIIGWARVLKDIPHRVIDVNPDPEIGTLIEVDLPDSPKERFLKVRCATGRDFVLAVNPECKTALAANMDTFDEDENDERPEFRT